MTGDPGVFVHPQGLCESDHVGPGTRVWAWAHVLPGAIVGADCNVCDHAFVEGGVHVGDRATIKNAVLLFDVPDEELVQRLSGRTVCDSCQTPYTGREPGSKCEKCGGTLVRRKDDEPAAVRNRLAVYQKQTAPVIDWYSRDGARMITIDAVGSTNDVLQRAMTALNQ